MTGYVALLRAVNLGGSTVLAMSDLKAFCEAAGFAKVRTYIASGNVVFASAASEKAVKAALESEIAAKTGKRIPVAVRSAKEIAAVLAQNPFAEAKASQVLVHFLDAPPPKDALAGVTGAVREEVRLGPREIYALYPDGIGRSKLKIPAAKDGTSRNVNTVGKLAEMAAAL